MGNEYITQEMLDMFLYETEQMLEQLEEIILSKKDDFSFDETSINDIFRIMHTIKGSSALMMYTNVTTVAHKLEDVFYFMRESHPEDVPHQELVGYVLEVADYVNEEIETIKAGGEANINDPGDIIDKIAAFLAKIKGDQAGVKLQEKKTASLSKKLASKHKKTYNMSPVASQDSKFYKIHIFYKEETEMCNIRAYMAVHALKEIAEDILYEPEDIVENEASAEYINENGFFISLQTKADQSEVEKLIFNTRIETADIRLCTPEEFLEEDIEEEEEEEVSDVEEDIVAEKPIVKAIEKKAAQKPMQSKKQDAGQTFISVNINKMNYLMDLIGELVIAEAMVLQNPDLKIPGLELSNFNKASAQLSKITSEMQDIIMSMRMTPLSNTFRKMNRIVYDMSRKLGKDIELDIIGEDTEMDKNIIEHISDPLMHLVRNSVDHGIEMPEERKARGKDSKGKILLEAKSEGGKVWIIVKDNGKGLNRDKLMTKARENGLLKKAEKDYTDKEVYNFITLPGFSTKQEVTEFSGRGVGMDVVMKNIQGVGGTLEIDSIDGQGSTMIMKIPLTLAIMDGIIFGVGDITFVVATTGVKEFGRVNTEQLIRDPNGEEFIMIRGDTYPIIRLNEFYHIQRQEEDIEHQVMAIIEYEGRNVCLLVDRLVGEQEIVVKPIPPYIKKVRGLSGCTQLGDGTIGLIIDPGGLIKG